MPPIGGKIRVQPEGLFSRRADAKAILMVDDRTSYRSPAILSELSSGASAIVAHMPRHSWARFLVRGLTSRIEARCASQT